MTNACSALDSDTALNLAYLFSKMARSSRSQMFLKIAVRKSRNIHRGMPVLKSFFDKVARLQVCELREIFKKLFL